jgi:UDP-3-O-[3-hydroxymyristoyl] N-acetylglucosamine deacetylase
MKQKTIRRSFSAAGIGIHSGEEAVITVKPAPENFGIVFIKNGEAIKASPENVNDFKLGTSLENVAVVEHFLAAAAGLGIDNLEIEIEGDELPILDGSALPFAREFLKAGIVELPVLRKVIEIKTPLTSEEEGKCLRGLPYDGFRINFMVDYPVIGRQEKTFEGEAGSFLKEIAPARTFGFVEKVKELRDQGKARGASLDNALAISQQGYLNPPRFPDEVVRHKILDLIGDLALLGGVIKGSFTAIKSNHKLNLALVKKIKRTEGEQDA